MGRGIDQSFLPSGSHPAKARQPPCGSEFEAHICYHPLLTAWEPLWGTADLQLLQLRQSCSVKCAEMSSSSTSRVSSQRSLLNLLSTLTVPRLPWAPIQRARPDPVGAWVQAVGPLLLALLALVATASALNGEWESPGCGPDHAGRMGQDCDSWTPARLGQAHGTVAYR